MDSLDRLAPELRAELGEPPPEWPAARRIGATKSSSVRPLLRMGAVVGVVCVVGAAAFWAAQGPGVPPVSSPPDPPSVWLAAETTRSPHRLGDGSFIELAEGARGRLSASGQGARFDLHAGKATFDVRHRPNQRWGVTAGSVRIEVVGTRFSVEFGPRDRVEVCVERGSVAVLAPGRAESIRLVAGDRLLSEGQRITLDQPKLGTGALTTVAPDGEASPPPGPASAAAPVASSTTTADDWRTLYRAGKYALALQKVKRLNPDRLMQSADAQTLSDLADTARLGGDPTLGANALVTLERRFPRSPHARPAPFLLGRIYAIQGRNQEATRAFEQYLTASPGGRYEAEAMGRLMALYRANGDTRKAGVMARRYLQHAPDGAYRQLAVSLVEQR